MIEFTGDNPVPPHVTTVTETRAGSVLLLCGRLSERTEDGQIEGHV